MKKNLVSVIIPAYNTELKLFYNCINSILNQDYENKEIIIVDDGSKAEFASEVDRISELNHSIAVIHQENAGEGAARNTGIKNCHGDFVIFVDSDDGLAPGWISYAVECCKRYDADIVTGKVIRVKQIPDKPEKCSHKPSECKVESQDLWKVQRDLFYFHTNAVPDLDILDPGVCSKLIRRECLVGLSFPVGIKLSSDQVFNHGMVRKCNTYVLTNRLSYYYVMNDMSISHVYQPKAVDYMMQSMSLIRPLVYDLEETRQAYYYRVLAEILEAIQYAYFSDRVHISLHDKTCGVRYACSNALVAECLQKIDIRRLPTRQWKFKARLLKKRMAFPFVFLKVLSDMFD